MRPLLIALLGLVAGTAAFTASWANASTPLVSRHTLLIRERGHDGICLSRIPEPPLGRPEKLSDDYELRAARQHGRVGPVVARAVSAAWSTAGHCGLNVTFHVRSNLSTFDFYDESTGDIWFDIRLPKLLDGRWTRTVIALGPR